VQTAGALDSLSRAGTVCSGDLGLSFYRMKPSSRTWAVSMPIKLDWRFTLLDHIGKVRVKELRDFARQAEEQLEDAMRTWNEESTGLSEEEEQVAQT
jgi:hypothetical protein